MILKRTFHPVGHGAFYTEQFYAEDSTQPCFTVVFDCGRFEAAKENWYAQKYKAWIEDYIKYQSDLNAGNSIDILFISHFHTDHINGIDYLLHYCKVNKVVIPAITPLTVLDAVVYNHDIGADIDTIINFFERCQSGDLREKVCQINIEDSERPNDLDSFQNIDDNNIPGIITAPGKVTVPIPILSLWCYIPFYQVDISRKTQLESELQKAFPNLITSGVISFTALRDEISKNGVRPFKDIYAKIFKDKHNSYSLTLYSGLINNKICHSNCKIKYEDGLVAEEVKNSQFCFVNCLYMGDYEAINDGLTKLKDYYSPFWKHIGVLQVPHHGSEHNSNVDLYSDKKRLCVISCDSHDKYDHPDMRVLSDIRLLCSIPLIVTEQSMTKQEFNINLP